MICYLLLIRIVNIKINQSSLHSTISKERSSNLGILSLKRKLVSRVEYTNLISHFASKKVKKMIFKKYLFILLKDLQSNSIIEPQIFLSDPAKISTVIK